MDIWEWFGEETRMLTRDGHTRLVRGLMRLPSLVCDDRHDEVDALVPELLAGVRGLGRPWLEVFVRHWHLQSRVLHRSEGESALAEAVSLVDFSHRDAHRGCPQSVCSVQDLTVCYSFTDGPGYAEERLSVTDETLDRIDPSWSCFGCISGERADALLDMGRAEEGLAFLERQVAARVVAGRKDADWSTAPESRMALLGHLGRFDELLRFIDLCDKGERDDAHDLVRRRIMRARAFVGLGRIDEAKAVFPAVEEIEPTPVFYGRWTAIARDLAEASAFTNDAALGRTLRAFTARLLRQGVYRETLHLVEHAGTLALLRGAPHVARRALASMKQIAAKLRKPLDALDRIAKLEQAIKAAPPPAPLPDSVEAVLEASGDDFMSEAALDLLERAHLAFPESSEITLRYSQALYVQGYPDDAVGVLRSAMASGASGTVATQLGSMLAANGALDEASRIADALIDAGDKARGHWVHARIADEQGQHAACASHLDALLAEEPGRVQARHLRVEASRKMGDYPAMLEHIEVLLATDPHPKLHWDRMLAATIAGKWRAVRSSATALGMPFEESDEPIYLEGSLCRIRYADAGETRELWARRVSPLTARILQISAPDAPSRTNDIVAFDAAPLNPPPATEADKEAHTWLYGHVATLHEGRCATYTIDGAYPGDDAWQELRTALGELGAVVQTQSGESYVLVRPGEEAPSLRGLYAFVAVPPDVPAAAVHARLSSAAAHFKDPLVWPALAYAAGDADASALHHAIVVEWGL